MIILIMINSLIIKTLKYSSINRIKTYKHIAYLAYPHKHINKHILSSFTTQKQQNQPKIKTQQTNSQSQQQTTSYRYTYALRYIVLGLFAAFLGYYSFRDQQCQLKKSKQEPKHQTLKIGGDWQLIDTQGKQVSSYDLKGSYYIIYFGFTKCPDICPTTLQYISTMKKHISDDQNGKNIPLKVVFISVDPQRDSPQQMKQYLSHFDPTIIGLSGLNSNDPKLVQIKKKFKIYSNKVSTQSSYSIDHTTIVYLMDKQNNFLDVINPSLSQKQSSKDIISKILKKQKP